VRFLRSWAVIEPVTMLRGTGQAGDNPMLIPLPTDHHRHDHSRIA
jgi:hypothetical protein